MVLLLGIIQYQLIVIYYYQILYYTHKRYNLSEHERDMIPQGFQSLISRKSPALPLKVRYTCFHSLLNDSIHSRFTITVFHSTITMKSSFFSLSPNSIPNKQYSQTPMIQKHVIFLIIQLYGDIIDASQLRIFHRQYVIARVMPRSSTKNITEAISWISPVFPESMVPIARQQGRIANSDSVQMIQGTLPGYWDLVQTYFIHLEMQKKTRARKLEAVIIPNLKGMFWGQGQAVLVTVVWGNGSTSCLRQEMQQVQRGRRMSRDIQNQRIESKRILPNCTIRMIIRNQ